jgi:hypothetical protein
MFEEPSLDEKLPYPTKPMYFADGSSVEEFIIPEEDREIVLEQLYPFSCTTSTRIKCSLSGSSA